MMTEHSEPLGEGTASRMCTPYYSPEMADWMQTGGVVLPQPLLLPLGRNGRVLVPIGSLSHQLSGGFIPLLPKCNVSGGEGPPQMRKLFVGGLNKETTDDRLRAYFSKYGQVVDSIVICLPNTKQSRGFGFVTFGTLAASESALADRPHLIDGWTVDTKRAIPREQMMPMVNQPLFDYDIVPGTKLTLTGINCDFHSVEALRLHFEKFGTLEQVEILGKPRGVGFVIFETKEGADRALAYKSGRHQINDKRVDVRPAVIPMRQSWKRRPVLPAALYEQLAALQLQQAAAMMAAGGPHPLMGYMTGMPAPPYEEDSTSYGNTTEDESKAYEESEHESTSSNSGQDSDARRKQST